VPRSAVAFGEANSGIAIAADAGRPAHGNPLVESPRALVETPPNSVWFGVTRERGRAVVTNLRAVLCSKLLPHRRAKSTIGETYTSVQVAARADIELPRHVGR
jgi:hypothetical protein